MDDEISKAILDFGGSGKNVIGDTVIAQLPLEDAVTPLASLPLSNTVISLLVSSLDAQQLADVCAYVVQQLEEEDKEQRLTVLTEALVDAVEVVNEEKEDVGAPEEPKTEEMDVDGETSTRTMPPGEKGVELIKLLMVRQSPTPCGLFPALPNDTVPDIMNRNHRPYPR
jgi:THO complex subunit 2